MPTLHLHTFQVGASRQRKEGVRLGTVRCLPRGVYKTDYARLNYFDVWLPQLAPSAALIRWARTHDLTAARDWRTFAERYRREMLTHTESRQTLALVAALACHTPLAVGCYCQDERHCHRSVLAHLIKEIAQENS